ncbi:MAG: DUF4136 domain-containing protein [Alcanivoracaceae bacterium]|jgi:hypothetical protein|nr:DUF4136 domain-containing protein [Alcanivoracaceae bacterium]
MRAIILLLTLWLAGCASTVAIDYRPEAAFADYRSFAFTNTEKNEEIRSLDGERIEQAVTRELTTRGLKTASADTADLLVRYRVEDTIEVEASGFGYGFGFGREHLGIGVASVPDVHAIKEGKLVVELVQRDIRQVVWRGAGQRNLTEQMKPEQRSALIERLVRDMFERWPPAAGS